jgi:ribose transport system ATP-binding protein
MTFLETRSISKRFGATVALDDVSINVQAGEIHAIVGENGSGKSTLMRILAGVMKPDSGQVILDGKTFRPNSPVEARRAGISMIHQELAICPDLTVAENIVLGIEKHRGGVLRLKEIKQIATNALGALGYSWLDPGTPTSTLSPAVRQVVEIARAVAEESRLIILDEPTSSLTAADIAHLFAMMRSLRDRGCTVLYISHFLNEIREICDRLTVLRDGKYIGVSVVSEISDEQIVREMVGRSIEELYPRSDHNPGDVALSIKHLSGLFKPTDATLDLRRGEVFGIAGLNGAGRTELLRVIFGLDPVKSGEIRIGVGASGSLEFSTSSSPRTRWRQRVGLLSEDRKLEGLLIDMEIAENIEMAGLDSPWVFPNAQRKESQVWIDRLRIRCSGPEQRVGELSGGNQQKVAIARLLRQDVDVLLLDEPTRGIDVGSKEQIYGLIDQLALQGKAVLIVSSYLPELLGTCDRIAVMNKGVLGKPIPIHEATQEHLMAMAVS